ncbi:hypothetical protein BGY98DRAFT_737415 [Russula aff. rugulosa BPL654]|nr:hypothetical protein BGY98DRAFT_737415 [Russula aff. rugulosa BPL654]
MPYNTKAFYASYVRISHHSGRGDSERASAWPTVVKGQRYGKGFHCTSSPSPLTTTRPPLSLSLSIPFNQSRSRVKFHYCTRQLRLKSCIQEGKRIRKKIGEIRPCRGEEEERREVQCRSSSAALRAPSHRNLVLGSSIRSTGAPFFAVAGVMGPAMRCIALHCGHPKVVSVLAALLSRMEG